MSNKKYLFVCSVRGAHISENCQVELFSIIRVENQLIHTFGCSFTGTNALTVNRMGFSWYISTNLLSLPGGLPPDWILAISEKEKEDKCDFIFKIPFRILEVSLRKNLLAFDTLHRLPERLFKILIGKHWASLSLWHLLIFVISTFLW